MRARHRWIVGAVAVGALVLGLWALPASAGHPNTKQLVRHAIAVSKAAKSVTIVGKITQGSQTISLHLTASASGTGKGSIGINGGVATVRGVGSSVYLKANKTFWNAQGGAQAAKLFAGRWVVTSATSADGQSLAQFLSSKTFFSQVFGGGLSSSTFTKVGTTKVHGRPVVVIAGHDKAKKTGGRVYIASQGRPYLLKLSISGSNGTGTVTFSHYNRAVHVVAPAHAINLDQLGAGSS